MDPRLLERADSSKSWPFSSISLPACMSAVVEEVEEVVKEGDEEEKLLEMSVVVEEVEVVGVVVVVVVEGDRRDCSRCLPGF